MRDRTRPGSHLFRLYFLAEVARKFPVVRGHSQYPKSPYDNGKQLVILTNRETRGEENEFCYGRCEPERVMNREATRNKGKDANGRLVEQERKEWNNN
jgi:hypothetical protein